VSTLEAEAPFQTARGRATDPTHPGRRSRSPRPRWTRGPPGWARVKPGRTARDQVPLGSV